MNRSLMLFGAFCGVAAGALVVTTFSSWATTGNVAFRDVAGSVVSTAVDPPLRTAGDEYASQPVPRLSPPALKALVHPARQSVMTRALEQGQPLRLAIQEGIAGYGASDGRVAALANRADAVCSQDPDPYGGVDTRYMDPTRVWAVQRAVDLCEGFDRGRFPLDPPRADSVSAALKRLGEQAAVASAHRTISGGWNRVALAEAGIFLLSTRRFPFGGIAPGADQRFGLAELESAWFMATDLALCGQVGGCGPDSLLVAEYCTRQGCQPGSDLVQAYRRNLPNDEFNLVLAFASWIQRQRLPVSG